jgi:cell fate (sporulation/competence/biofilm development) regulator YmcA (YheA/YmcA/DUF963 family)
MLMSLDKVRLFKGLKMQKAESGIDANQLLKEMMREIKDLKSSG